MGWIAKQWISKDKRKGIWRQIHMNLVVYVNLIGA
jgi:hypothetical protein